MSEKNRPDPDPPPPAAMATRDAPIDTLGLRTADAGAGEMRLASREASEIQAGFIMARQFPRDEQGAFVKLVDACKRPTFADGALYRFPRGGESVEGPSVKMAREIARLWGNLRYGYDVIEADELRTTVEGYAYDLQTNARKAASVSFRNLIYRRDGGWIQPDERDYRELVARNGAIVERNAILQIIPSDVIEAAVEHSRTTIRKAAEGEIERDRAGTIRSLALAFSEFGVTTDALEKKLGKPLAEIDPIELANLKMVYVSIRDDPAEKRRAFPDEETAGSALDSLAAGYERKRAQKKDQVAKAKGFASEKELLELVAKPDLSHPDIRALFETWKKEDGTKPGLLAIIEAAAKPDAPPEKPKAPPKPKRK